jgi:general secretion pathway protein H
LAGPKDSGGFTLLELLVVLAILGLTLVLATPMIGRVMPGLELRTQAHDVATALREARARAIGRNEVVTIVVDRERRTLEADGKPLVRLNRAMDMSVLRTMPRALAADDVMRFFPDGTSTGGRLTLALGAGQEHVVVDWLTGAVSLED